VIRKKVLMACANYWNSPFQVGSHHLARGFINSGWEVAFISSPISPIHFLKLCNLNQLKKRFYSYYKRGSHEYEGRLWEYVPGALLTPYNKPVLKGKWLHRNWYRISYPNVIKEVKRNGFDDVDLLYIDDITQHFWLNKIKYKKSVLRVADYNVGFTAKYTNASKILEEEVAQSVDLVIYTAKKLEQYVKSMKPKDVLHVPNGVNFYHFNACRDLELPEEYKNIPKPIVIYVGSMHEWFDFETVNYAARCLPGVSFVFIGNAELAQVKLDKLSNIHLLGMRNYQNIPKYLHGADVGIIPFDIINHAELINSVNPLKLYEYMACGLPVVSTEWEELKSLKTPARLCKNREEFVKSIEESLNTPHNKNIYIDYAKQRDWSVAINAILTRVNM
jgi:glycosyltransferase involved in cell wall biosynthesis